MKGLSCKQRLAGENGSWTSDFFTPVDQCVNIGGIQTECAFSLSINARCINSLLYMPHVQLLPVCFLSVEAFDHMKNIVFTCYKVFFHVTSPFITNIVNQLRVLEESIHIQYVGMVHKVHVSLTGCSCVACGCG